MTKIQSIHSDSFPSVPSLCRTVTSSVAVLALTFRSVRCIWLRRCWQRSPTRSRASWRNVASSRNQLLSSRHPVSSRLMVAASMATLLLTLNLQLPHSHSRLLLTMLHPHLVAVATVRLHLVAVDTVRLHLVVVGTVKPHLVVVGTVKPHPNPSHNTVVTDNQLHHQGVSIR